ncbi:MAG: histidine kinase, partial [Clostridia bacterium]|nr:histidine kinase [Clostridia bacterium]
MKNINSFFSNALEKIKNINYYLRYKITFFVLIAILLPTVFFGIYIFEFVNNQVYNNYIESTLKQTSQHINDSIVTNYRIIESTALQLISNQNIIDNLGELNNNERTYYLNELTKLNIETELKTYFGNNYSFNSELVNSIFVFADENTFYSSFYNELPTDDSIDRYAEFFKNNFNSKSDIISFEKNNNTIYYMKDIKNQITSKSLGKLIIGINFNALNGSYAFSDDNIYLVTIYGEDGIIKYCSDFSYIGKQVSHDVKKYGNILSPKFVNMDNESIIIQSSRTNDINLTATIFAYQDKLRGFEKALPIYLYFVIFAVFLSIIVSIYVLNYITKPLDEIIVNIKAVSDGNYKLKMKPSKYKGLNEVSMVYNTMIDKIQYLISEVYEKQLLIKESELKALHAQINPHFIFNVLETISWEARNTDNEKVERMTTSLAQILRRNICLVEKEKITIEDELQYVRFYLYLQSVRFEERYTINIKIMDDD